MRVMHVSLIGGRMVARHAIGPSTGRQAEVKLVNVINLSSSLAGVMEETNNKTETVCLFSGGKRDDLISYGRILRTFRRTSTSPLPGSIPVNGNVTELICDLPVYVLIYFYTVFYSQLLTLECLTLSNPPHIIV